MTKRNQMFARATTAIAAVLALSSTPLLAQETPTADPLAATTSSEPAASVDPLAPAAAKPKAAATRTAVKRTTTTKRTVVHKAAAAAPVAAAPAAPAETATPAPMPAEPVPPVMAEPGPMPVAEEAAPVEAKADPMTTDEMLPIAGGLGLGLLALGGAGLAMSRRKRRDEDAEFAARQQFLEAHEGEREAAEPAISRAAMPIHDPVPEPGIPARGNWESRPDADFLFRRDGKAEQRVN